MGKWQTAPTPVIVGSPGLPPDSDRCLRGFAAYQHDRRMGLGVKTSNAFRDDSMRFQLSLTGSEDDKKPSSKRVANGHRAPARYQRWKIRTGQILGQ